MLYWNIGRIILKHQQQEGWGSKVIDLVAKNLASEFPQLKGFSARNLKYMRKFAQENNELGFVQEVLAQITWYHNITLLEKVKSHQERVWYVNKTIENGWSRNVLVHQIESQLYQRQVLADKTTNFKSLMPAIQSDLGKSRVCFHSNPPDD